MNKLIIFILAIMLIGTAFAETMTQQVYVEVLPGEIEIYLPVQEQIYTERMIKMNLSMNTEVERFTYYDNGVGPGTLCRRCKDFGFLKTRKMPFDDGFHEVIILAEFKSGTIYGYRNFTVDTAFPKITKTAPNRGFSKGDFQIEFQEENPIELKLKYGNQSLQREAEVELEECVQLRTKRTRCEFSIDLEEFDKQEISYNFNITDILRQSTENKAKKINIDSSLPVIKNPDSFWAQKGKYIYFNISIQEENLDEVLYLDSMDGKENRLCSNLNKNKECIARRTFRLGEHNLTLKVLDKAGNEVSKEFSFIV